MSAWVKKRKICVRSERSCSVNFCAQSRQSSPRGTSSGIQWICCWRFQYSNAQGYSNGLYCLRASRRGMSVHSGIENGEGDRGANRQQPDDRRENRDGLAAPAAAVRARPQQQIDGTGGGG